MPQLRHPRTRRAARNGRSRRDGWRLCETTSKNDGPVVWSGGMIRASPHPGGLAIFGCHCARYYKPKFTLLVPPKEAK